MKRSVDEHLERVRGLAPALAPVRCGLREAVGAVLAEPIVSRLSVPPFDNSAMDGFAVRAADLRAGAVLQVVADVPAGTWSDVTVGAGQAARIMTGAPVPAGADTIVPVELTDQPRGAAPVPTHVRLDDVVEAGRHIRRAGENVSPGDVVLASGVEVTAAVTSSAASAGLGDLLVVPRPRVAVIVTGSELVAPGTPLQPGQIPDSNSILVAGLVEQFGAELASVVTVGDAPGDFARAIDEAVAVADLVVTTGGVSVGAFDVVREVLGDRVEFTEVAMQPGKPQASGALEGPRGLVPVLGLPGNPVSVFVSAWVFVRTAIAGLAGRSGAWSSVELVADAGWRSPPGRRQFVPVAMTATGVTPVHRLGSGSHLAASLALAEGLAVIPESCTEVTAGQSVVVHDIRS